MKKFFKGYCRTIELNPQMQDSLRQYLPTESFDLAMYHIGIRASPETDRAKDNRQGLGKQGGCYDLFSALCYRFNQLAFLLFLRERYFAPSFIAYCEMMIKEREKENTKSKPAKKGRKTIQRRSKSKPAKKGRKNIQRQSKITLSPKRVTEKSESSLDILLLCDMADTPTAYLAKEGLRIFKEGANRE